MKAYLLSYLFEASVCQTTFYLFYCLFLRKETSFSFNRIYLLLSVLLAVVIPFIEIPVREDAVYLPYQTAIADITPFSGESPTYVFVKEASEIKHYENYLDSIFYLYVFIGSLLLIRFLCQLAQLLYFYINSFSVKHPDYRLIHTNGKLPTFSFFRLLFWDNSKALSTENAGYILIHELTHIRQWHSLDIVLMELLKIIFWFNPAIYLMKKALQHVHEYLADAAVVTQQNAATYIQLMVSQLFSNLHFSFTSSFNQSQLKTRIAMIRQHKSAKPALWKATLSLPLVVLLTFVYSCRTSELAELNQHTPVEKESIYQLNEIVVIGFKGNRIRQMDLNGKIIGYESANEPGILNNATIPPAPVAGMSNFQQYMNEHIQATTAKGKVFVQFIVNKDGSLSNLSVVRGLGAGYDEQAIQLIANGPTWKPGKQRGVPVNVRMVIPVSFGEENTSFLLSQVEYLVASSQDKPAAGKPVPEEGLDMFYKQITKTLKYPGSARMDGIGGKVVVQFVVKADGSLSGFEVVEGVVPELDQEVIRTVANAGLPWKPAMQNGKPIENKLLLPITFKIGG